MLIGGRAVQGIGGAGLLNGAFITIAAAAPKDLKPRTCPCVTSVLMLTWTSLCRGWYRDFDYRVGHWPSDWGRADGKCLLALV